MRPFTHFVARVVSYKKFRRWLRLLFTREFSFSESMILWDGLFASVVIEDTPSSSSPSINGFGFTLWIGVAMLMRIRNYRMFRLLPHSRSVPKALHSYFGQLHRPTDLCPTLPIYTVSTRYRTFKRTFFTTNASKIPHDIPES